MQLRIRNTDKITNFSYSVLLLLSYYSVRYSKHVCCCSGFAAEASSLPGQERTGAVAASRPSTVRSRAQEQFQGKFTNIRSELV